MATAFTDHDDFYKMDASPKGICLIINNFEFERSRRLDTGPADKENLTHTFKKMNFEVRYFENQTCAQMKTRMETIEKEDHSSYDCFVCCISSHGNKTGVCGADDLTVNISELQEYVYSTQCPSLAGKPKVFFVDACRGGEGQTDIFWDTEAELKRQGNSWTEAERTAQSRVRWRNVVNGLCCCVGHCLARSGAPVRGVVITDKRDFLLSFATTPDNVAYCNPDSTKGAVYFYHLTRLLERYAKSKTLMHILHKLNEALTEESQGNKLQTAEYLSTLAKKLRFYCPVQAMVRALQQEITEARSRVQVLEQEVKRKDDQIKKNDTDSANQLQAEKARHQNTAKQLQDCNKTCSALKTELQEEKARHQNTAKQLQDLIFVLEEDVASYQRQLRELQNKAPVRETSVTQPSRPTHPQTQAFRFHDNHGEYVELSNDQQTAQYRSKNYYCGIVMSRDPMEVNKLYEVRITKRGEGWWQLCVGVVTSLIDSQTLSESAWGRPSAVVVYSGGFTDRGACAPTDIGKALEYLRVDSRVGVSVDPSRRLHLHVNGVDQGVVPCRSLPDPCWALWELCAGYPEVQTLPVTTVP